MTQPKKHNPTGQHTLLLAVDFQKSVLAEIDAGRTNRMAYTAYGQQSAQHDVITRLGFNGELREEKLDWYALGNGYRVYNPWLMRFHSSDSLSPFGRGGINSYMYCGGEPVMNSDPTGHYFGSLLSGARTLLGGLRTIPTSAAKMLTAAVKQTASSVNNGISGVAKSINKTWTDIFSFDVKAATQNKFPPIEGSRPRFVTYPNRYTNPKSNHVRAQQQTTQSATKPRQSVQRPSTSQWEPTNTYDHVRETRASSKLTLLLDRNGETRGAVYLRR
jgi:RHS repeat-associated protein